MLSDTVSLSCSIINEGWREAFRRDVHGFSVSLLTGRELKTLPSCRHKAGGGKRSQQRDGQPDVPVLC